MIVNKHVALFYMRKLCKHSLFVLVIAELVVDSTVQCMCNMSVIH